MILFDENKDFGTKQFYSYNPDTDEHTLTTVQDVSGLLDSLKAKRALTPEHGRVEEWAHYASVPPVVQVELMNRGLNIQNPDHLKAIIKEINTNYPYLKSTTKHHA